jgi:hypothetical protein
MKREGILNEVSIWIFGNASDSRPEDAYLGASQMIVAGCVSLADFLAGMTSDWHLKAKQQGVEAVY